jgi:hypothetical protein
VVLLTLLSLGCQTCSPLIWLTLSLGCRARRQDTQRFVRDLDGCHDRLNAGTLAASTFVRELGLTVVDQTQLSFAWTATAQPLRPNDESVLLGPFIAAKIEEPNGMTPCRARREVCESAASRDWTVIAPADTRERGPRRFKFAWARGSALGPRAGFLEDFGVFGRVWPQQSSNRSNLDLGLECRSGNKVFAHCVAEQHVVLARAALPAPDGDAHTWRHIRPF